MKTKFDVYKAAALFALETSDVTDQHELDTKALENFNAQGGQPADWFSFKEIINAQRDLFARLKQQPSPSAVAAAMVAVTQSPKA